MATTAMVASPPVSPERSTRIGGRGGTAAAASASSSASTEQQQHGTATWSRTSRRTAMAQRNRTRTLRRQANISSHVLGFRRNRTWRQAFLHSSITTTTTTSSSSQPNSTDSTTTTTDSSQSPFSSSPPSSSFPSSFFRLGRRSSTATTTSDSAAAATAATTKSLKSKNASKESIDSLLLLLKALRNQDPAVQQIVLDNTSLPWQYTAALLRAVADSPHVWRVQLRKVGADDRIASALEYCVEHSVSLIDLDLSKNSLGYQAAQALAQGWTRRAAQMKKLALAANNNNGNGKSSGGGGCCSALGSSAAHGACPLQRLNLEGNALDPDALHKMSVALTTGATPNLQILKLGRNVHFGADGMAILCEVLLRSEHCPVTWLDVRGNFLGDAGVWPLAQALAEPTCPLEFLSLQKNHITNDGVAALAQAIENNTRLQTLDLQRNPDLDNAGAAALVESLWHNHVFTKLKIRHTHVSGTAVKSELFDLLLMNTYGPTLAASTKASLQQLQAEPRKACATTTSDNTTATTPCVICFEANRQAGHAFGVLLPCRHDNACWACCQRLRGHCHMCRSPIVKVVAL